MGETARVAPSVGVCDHAAMTVSRSSTIFPRRGVPASPARGRGRGARVSFTRLCPKLVIMAWLASLGCGGDPGEARPFEHIVLISLDTTRADHLGCYGSSQVQTPSIDSIAEQGVVFTDVTAPAPTTLASHTSMMTGCYPQTHGIPRNGFVINQSNVMLAEILQSIGFHTAAFLGSFALERRFAFNQGFDCFDENFEVLIKPGGVDQNQRSGMKVAQAALRHLDEAHPEHLFLFAHFFDAHLPYDPPEAYARRHMRPGEPLKGSMNDAEQLVAHHQYAVTGEAVGLSGIVTLGLTTQLVEEARHKPFKRDELFARLYSAEIEGVDAAVGELLRGLDERGYLEDALVIITGDHGETFWEHGDVWNHGLWVHQTTVSIPMILRFPHGRYRGLRIDEPVSTIDLLPTLVDLLDVPLPARVDGVSLLPLLEQEAFERGPLFSQATQPMGRHEGQHEWRDLQKPRCIRAGKWKYIHAPYLDLEQLYDLESDPGEMHNLLRSEPLDASLVEVRNRLRAQLDQWVAGAHPLPTEMNNAQMQETMERLRALGYGGFDPGDDSEGK